MRDFIRSRSFSISDDIIATAVKIACFNSRIKWSVTKLCQWMEMILHLNPTPGPADEFRKEKCRKGE